MKKTVSMLLALLLAITCTSCSSKDTDGDAASDPQTGPESIYTTLTDLPMSETVLELDGTAIPADIYLYYLVNTANTLEYNLNMSAMYGMYAETLDENGRVKWDQSLEGTPLVDIVSRQAENNALSYALLVNVANDHNVPVTGEEQATLDEQLTSQIEQAGGEEAFRQNLYEMGLSMDSLNRLRSTDYLYQHLLELAQDPSSDIYAAPSDDNAYVDHILLMTKDAETNEPLSEEEIAAKKSQAEELLAQLQSSSDLEKDFTEMADTYGEDPGRASDAGYFINPDTNFVQEFKDAAFALHPGEISGIVESDYGYHILLRKELTEDHLRTLAEEQLGNYLDAQMTAAMDRVTRSEKLDGIDAGTFYTGYIDALSALHPEEDTADTGDTDGASDSDIPADGDAPADSGAGE